MDNPPDSERVARRLGFCPPFADCEWRHRREVYGVCTPSKTHKQIVRKRTPRRGYSVDGEHPRCAANGCLLTRLYIVWEVLTWCWVLFAIRRSIWSWVHTLSLLLNSFSCMICSSSSTFTHGWYSLQSSMLGTTVNVCSSPVESTKDNVEVIFTLLRKALVILLTHVFEWTLIIWKSSRGWLSIRGSARLLSIREAEVWAPTQLEHFIGNISIGNQPSYDDWYTMNQSTISHQSWIFMK